MRRRTGGGSAREKFQPDGFLPEHSATALRETRLYAPAMSKRKVNFGAITSEAARRQLMVPTPCWERVLAMPEDVTPGTTWKVYKWVKTDRQQVRLPRTFTRVRLKIDLW